MAPGSRRGTNKIVSFSESAVVAVDITIILGDLDTVRPHCFAGVQFFSDPEGLVPVVPSTGSLLLEVQTVNSTPVFEAVPSNIIDASAPSTLSWAANTKAVRITPSGVVGAVYYKLVVTCNEN